MVTKQKHYPLATIHVIIHQRSNTREGKVNLLQNFLKNPSQKYEFTCM